MRRDRGSACSAAVANRLGVACALGASVAAGWAARRSQREVPVIAQALLALSLVIAGVALLLVLAGGTSC